MSRSGTAAAIFRWIFLGLLIVAAVALSYFAIAASGWTVGEVPAAPVMAAVSGFVVLAIVRYVLSRSSGPKGRIDLRLDRIPSLTTPSEPSDARQEVGRGGVAHATKVDEQPAVSDSLRDPDDAHVRADGTIGAPPSDERSAQPLPPRPMNTAISQGLPEPRSTPIREPIGEEVIEDIGIDAMRLAAALNRAEHSDLRAGRYTDPNATGPQRYDRALGQRESWNELAHIYGGGSIDLHDIVAGRCLITLTSGNIVFYAPEHQRWVWLVFDQRDPVASSDFDVPLGGHHVNTPARAAQEPSTHPASPDPLRSRDGVPDPEEALAPLLRLAQFPDGRSDPSLRPTPHSVRLGDMTQVLSSQNTPAAYEEALFATEGLLLGAAYGDRFVAYEELAWVVEAATGHSLQLQSLGRFLGDLVDRSYPRHMDVLSAFAVPASDSSRIDADDRDTASSATARPLRHEATAGGAVVDLTETAMQSQ